MNTLNQNKSKKFATGWLIVVACMLIQAIPFGVASNIQPQFVSYVVEEKGFTLAGFSLIFTLGTIVSAVASPFIGMMFNKISAKTMYLLGAILSGGGFLAFSMCQELWQFYIVAGIVQVGTSIISSIGIPLLINSWFDDTTKGKALGLAFAGSGLGNIFLQQMTAYSLVNFGSSKSYLMFGALSLIVGIPVSLLFLRMPKNNSEIVKGNKKENGKEESQNMVSSPTSLTAVPSENRPTSARLTRSPTWIDCAMAQESTVCTPITLTDGSTAFMYTDTPAARLPPPIGTNTASSRPGCWRRISMPTVPWPAIT